jgi:hypothetical protein
MIDLGKKNSMTKNLNWFKVIDRMSTLIMGVKLGR